MKLLTLLLLSPLAAATPQEIPETLEQRLSELFEEIEPAPEQKQEPGSEPRFEQLGLRIAEGALNAVAELIPEATRTAASALASANRQLGEEDRIVIGITGGTPSEALCSHLGLDPARTIIVHSVGPGMSADQAGLRVHDLIIGIEGDTNVTLEKLSEALSRKQLGQALRLTIVTRGEPRPLEIPLLPKQEWTGTSNRTDLQWLRYTDPESSGFYDDESLRDLAQSQQIAKEVELEFMQAQEELARSRGEINSARAEYNRVLAELTRAEAQQNSQSVEVAEQLRVLEQYNELLAHEASRQLSMREIESRRLAELQAAQARAKELRAREEAQFMDPGRRSSLLVPERRWDRTARVESEFSERVEMMEHRVDELHSRFDRLEELIERIATRDNR